MKCFCFFAYFPSGGRGGGGRGRGGRRGGGGRALVALLPSCVGYCWDFSACGSEKNEKKSFCSRTKNKVKKKSARGSAVLVHALVRTRSPSFHHYIFDTSTLHCTVPYCTDWYTTSFFVFLTLSRVAPSAASAHSPVAEAPKKN